MLRRLIPMRSHSIGIRPTRTNQFHQTHPKNMHSQPDPLIFQNDLIIHEKYFEIVSKETPDFETNYKLLKLLRSTNTDNRNNRVKIEKINKILDEIININHLSTETVKLLLTNISKEEYSQNFQRLIKLKYKFVNCSTTDSEYDDLLQHVLIYLSNGSMNEFECFLNCGVKTVPNEYSNNKKISKINAQTEDTFMNQYSYSMMESTIILLIDKRYRSHALKFLKMFEKKLNQEQDNSLKMNHTDKLHQLEDKFNIKFNKSPSFKSFESIETTVPELLKYYINEKYDLSSYLKILDKYLILIPNPSSSIIKIINLNFLRYLSQRPEVNLEMLVCYILALYPSSEKLLIETGILNMVYNGTVSRSFDPYPHEFEKPSIREELIMHDELPSLKIIALVYGEYMFEYNPSKSTLKRLLDVYLTNVSTVQQQHEYDDGISNHPYSKKNHSSVIIESFLRYANESMKKSEFGSNLLTSYLSHKPPLTTTKFHKDSLSNTISRLTHKDLTLATWLTLYFINKVRLNPTVYLAIVQRLVQIGDVESAKLYYDTLLLPCGAGSKLVGFNHLGRLVWLYDWDAPDRYGLKEFDGPDVIEDEEEEGARKIEIERVMKFLDDAILQSESGGGE